MVLLISQALVLVVLYYVKKKSITLLIYGVALKIQTPQVEKNLKILYVKLKKQVKEDG